VEQSKGKTFAIVQESNSIKPRLDGVEFFAKSGSGKI